MSDNTPTQRFDAPVPEGQGGTEGQGEPEEKKKSRALMIALIIVGAVLLIAIIILIVVLATRGSGSPSAGPSTSTASSTPSDTPSATPSATAAPTPTPNQTVAPAPPSNAPVINSFQSGSSSVLCNESAPAGDHQPISFSWNSSNVDQVYFGVNTNDASTASLFSNLPPSGNSNDDFPDGYNHGDYEYPCTAASTKFTLTVVGNGQKVSKSVTIVNHGDQ